MPASHRPRRQLVSRSRTYALSFPLPARSLCIPGSGVLLHPIQCLIRYGPVKKRCSINRTAERMLWNPDCRLCWRQRSRSGKDICLDERTLLRFSLIRENLRSPIRTECLRYITGRGDNSPQTVALWCVYRCAASAFFHRHPAHGQQTLHYVSVMHPL